MFEIDERIQVAQTPPGKAYCDPSIFRLECDHVFTRAWLAAPRIPAESGHVDPFVLLPGAMDEPLILTRDEAGSLGCISNVCTHRGMEIVCEAGSVKRLRCPYHGRRFHLDGTLESAPGFEGAENFPRATDNLHRVNLAPWGPMAFVSLNPLVPFQDWVSSLTDWLAFLPLDELTPDPGATRRFDVAANWKLYLDNYLEGFHIPTVHKGLAKTLDLAGYRVELLRGGSVQIGIASGDGPVLPLGPDHPLAGQKVGALYFHLFPNTLLNVYPWGLSVNHVNPVGPMETEVIFERYVWRPALLGQGAGGDLDLVEMEDEAVVEATQRGLRSRLYERGRYAPKHEAAVHHFHRLWVAHMEGLTPLHAPDD